MSGAVKVTKLRASSIITLQNSKVKEIEEKEYKAGLATQVNKLASAEAPASAPTAALSVASTTASESSSVPTGTE
jgi:hypothetical protein